MCPLNHMECPCVQWIMGMSGRPSLNIVFSCWFISDCRHVYFISICVYLLSLCPLVVMFILYLFMFTCHLHVHFHLHSPGRRAQSMDNLSPSENKTFDARGFSTPGSTPTGTPSMTRSSSKTKLGRRGSEPDLEGACECTVSINPMVPVWARRTSISLWDLIWRFLAYILVHVFCVY